MWERHKRYYENENGRPHNKAWTFYQFKRVLLSVLLLKAHFKICKAYFCVFDVFMCFIYCFIFLVEINDLVKSLNVRHVIELHVFRDVFESENVFIVISYRNP